MKPQKAQPITILRQIIRKLENKDKVEVFDDGSVQVDMEALEHIWNNGFQKGKCSGYEPYEKIARADERAKMRAEMFRLLEHLADKNGVLPYLSILLQDIDNYFDGQAELKKVAK